MPVLGSESQATTSRLEEPSHLNLRTMKFTQLNHVAIHVSDVAKSSAFYRDVLQLQEIPRPAFPFPGAWFLLGTDQELHLIGNRSEPVASHHRGNHYALMVDDMDAWEAFFQQHQVPYLPRRTRPDGAFQIYVTDPDGHVIELCTPPPASSPSGSGP